VQGLHLPLLLVVEQDECRANPALAAFSRTMSGRRLRDAVRESMVNAGFPSDVIVVIAGLTNTYSDYVATYEEFQV